MNWGPANAVRRPVNILHDHSKTGTTMNELRGAVVNEQLMGPGSLESWTAGGAFASRH
jgi:hypothetical protein